MSHKAHILICKAMLLVCTLLASCSLVEEDMSNCPEQVRVYFTYTASRAGGDPGIDPADVDRMNLYVFCNKGYFLGEYRDQNIAFGPNYYIDCSDLLPGHYRLIAWGGKDESCYATSPEAFVKGQTSFDEALLHLSHYGNAINTPPHHLFHAELNTVTVTNQKVQRFDMPLIQISNRINIRTEGLPADADVYSFSISDNNCAYKFDSSFAPDSECHAINYITSCTKDAQKQLSASLNVLKLAAGRRRPQLLVYNQTAGRALYPTDQQSGDLIDMILDAYPSNDFDAVSTYDILLTFAGDATTGLIVTVTINGWQVKNNNGDLIPD